MLHDAELRGEDSNNAKGSWYVNSWPTSWRCTRWRSAALPQPGVRCVLIAALDGARELAVSCERDWPRRKSGI